MERSKNHILCFKSPHVFSSFLLLPTYQMPICSYHCVMVVTWDRFNECQSKLTIVNSWSSLVAGNEGSYLPNCQTNIVIVLHALYIFFCNFINTTAYLWDDTSPHLSLAVKLQC